MKILNKLAATAAAVIMAVCTVAPTAVFAEPAETYSITVDQNGVQSVDTKHVYTAYQVFTGNYSNGVLSDIAWGDGVDGNALLAALKADTSFGEGETNTFADCADGADVAAKMTSENGFTDNSEKAKAFARLAAKNTKGSGVASENGVISGLSDGYYLVKENGAAAEGDSLTAAILKVVGSDVTVNRKTSNPSVDKQIYEDTGSWGEVGDFDIGQEISFRVVVDLPSDWTDYDKYFLNIHDQFDGITLDADTAELWYIAPNTDLSDSETMTEGKGVTKLTNGYEISNTGADGKTNAGSVDVKFTDVKTVTVGEGNPEEGGKIVLTYKGTLTGESNVGDAGSQVDNNNNYAEIIYSNNPDNSGDGEDGDTGTSPKDYAFAFTYELDTNKVDADDGSVTLEGAKFKLYKTVDSAKNYAVVEGGKLTGWTENEAEASELVTDGFGRFEVAGLDADTYYLEETEAPKGYNKLAKPVKVVISADLKEENETGSIETLTISVDNGEAADGDKTTGTVEAVIKNSKGSTLPSTGGIGTKIFHGVGSALVLGSGVLLISKNRMKKEQN